MANAANADFFLAIHSNGFDGTQNQPLMLFRGYDDQPVYPESKGHGTELSGIRSMRKGNCWTSIFQMGEGRLDFLSRLGNTGPGMYSVDLQCRESFLRVPFHDYIPEGWRLRKQ
ncbi:MAG: hypothetical protein MZV63_20055 [Marinilabiliales bacterium]|nr:hypothetical protein [Marinilabiliales bacterium]